MFSILVDRAWAIQQYADVSIIGALGMGIDGVDRVIRPATAALSASRAIRAVVTPGLMIILVAVSVITVVLIVMAVIITALVVSGAGSPFGFFGVDISVCYLYQFTNGCGPLVV